MFKLHVVALIFFSCSVVLDSWSGIQFIIGNELICLGCSFNVIDFLCVVFVCGLFLFFKVLSKSL